ncbi:MAG: type III polyketide synthase [Candidatus Brocadiales bacterium]|nr:type III polyketide synthase [Candidatus Brocadiales bacterium]
MAINDKNMPVDYPCNNARIAAISVVTPTYSVTQPQAEAFLKKYYSDKLSRKSLKVMHKVFSHPSVLHRYLAVDAIENLVDEHPDIRIARFTKWAVELASQAIVKALAQAKLDVSDVTGLVVNTCTGYICPGISTYLIERLGLSERIRAHDLVGSGCGGAIPNLQMCSDMLDGHGDGVLLSVSVEICSATFQMADDLSLIVSNAIFADGASASVLGRRPAGLALVASSSRYDTCAREDIRYVYKNGQLHNQLSISLPEIAGKTVARVVMDLLNPRGLKVEDIKHWAFHPGGEKVINAIRDELRLPESHIKATRNVLAKYGNMSSPTVYFVLQEILNNGGMKTGDWCVMVAFGAGLCAHALLLRA